MMLDNYDYEKIARIVNKDKKVVYNTIHRVKQKIKEILEEEKNVTN